MLQPETETVQGTPGDDTITAYSLDELIFGFKGDDTIDGRAGDDVLSGGLGNDQLTGGAGTDAFLFDVKPKPGNADHITDFVPGTDQIALDLTVFKALKAGILKKGKFVSGKHATEALDSHDRIIYDTKSGDLRYDKDGFGGHNAKLIATLDGSPNDLSHSDIVVA